MIVVPLEKACELFADLLSPTSRTWQAQRDNHPEVIGQFWERFAGRFAPRRPCNASDRFTCQATSGQRSTVKLRPPSPRLFCRTSRATFYFTSVFTSLLTST